MPLAVDAAAATRQNLATYVTLDGQIAPLEQSTLAFQQSGTITEIAVNIGDMVHKGALLARIDPSTLQAQLSQAQAQAAQQSASAQGAVVGYPVQVQTNQAQVQSAKANLDNAKLVYDQNKQLFKQGYVSETTAATVASELRSSAADVQQRGRRLAQRRRQRAEREGAAGRSCGGRRTSPRPRHAALADVPIRAVRCRHRNRLVDPGAYRFALAARAAGRAHRQRCGSTSTFPTKISATCIRRTIVTFQSTSLPGQDVLRLRSTPSTRCRRRERSRTWPGMELQNPGYVLRGGMLVTVTVTKAAGAVDAIVVPRSAVAQTPKATSSTWSPTTRHRRFPSKSACRPTRILRCQPEDPARHDGRHDAAGRAQRRQPRRRQQRELGHVEQRRGALRMNRSKVSRASARCGARGWARS